jgi:hypothetical protein
VREGAIVGERGVMEGEEKRERVLNANSGIYIWNLDNGPSGSNRLTEAFGLE